MPQIKFWFPPSFTLVHSGLNYLSTSYHLSPDAHIRSLELPLFSSFLFFTTSLSLISTYVHITFIPLVTSQYRQSSLSRITPSSLASLPTSTPISSPFSHFSTWRPASFWKYKSKYTISFAIPLWSSLSEGKIYPCIQNFRNFSLWVSTYPRLELVLSSSLFSLLLFSLLLPFSSSPLALKEWTLSEDVS